VAGNRFGRGVFKLTGVLSKDFFFSYPYPLGRGIAFNKGE
jgi:hypothetical protein